MLMSDYELLSRMLSGDLSRAEARALKQRIKEEPDLARAWEAMSSLPDLLARMPEATPEDRLNARVLAAQRRTRSLRPLVPWAVAAAALLAVALWPEPDFAPELVLLEGRQVVDGELSVLAADVPIAVDGRVEISVEPPRGAARVSGQEDPEMKLANLGAALAGAAVTVAVYEGTATVNADAADAVTLSAGETRTVSAAPGGGDDERVIVTRTGGAELEGASREELAQRVAELEAELEKLAFEHQVNRGRLSAIEGTPQDWPDTLAAAFKPDSFQAMVEETFAGMEEMELLSLDCSEYPCLAVAQSFVEGETWSDQASDTVKQMADGLDYEGEVSESIWASKSVSETGETQLVGFVLHPDEGWTQENQDRTSWRMDSTLKDALQEVGGGH
jgi:hypothetical protein